MRWSDNSPVEFTNWEDGSSPGIALVDTCGVLHSNTGKWEKVSCLDEVENGVVCEAKQGTMSHVELNIFFFLDSFELR